MGVNLPPQQPNLLKHRINLRASCHRHPPRKPALPPYWWCAPTSAKREHSPPLLARTQKPTRVGNNELSWACADRSLPITLVEPRQHHDCCRSIGAKQLQAPAFFTWLVHSLTTTTQVSATVCCPHTHHNRSSIVALGPALWPHTIRLSRWQPCSSLLPPSPHWEEDFFRACHENRLTRRIVAVLVLTAHNFYFF